MVFPAVAEQHLHAIGLIPALLATGPLRILLIDDDLTVLRSLHEALAQDRRSVDPGDGGSRGIELSVTTEQRGERYSVVITDLGICRMSTDVEWQKRSSQQQAQYP